MLKKSIRFSAVIILISMIVLSCQKGDTGPAGPEGPEGPEGPPGANVIYSPWLDVTYAEGDDDNGDGDPDFYGATIPAAKLTASIMNSGAVHVYLNIGASNDPVVVSIPYGVNILSAFYENTIELIGDDDYSTFTVQGVKVNQYRYVLIPGEETARVMAGGKKIDWKNYNEVKAYLQLKD
ncbi:hypothetical protein [Pollutibacter soli]|uniref:hypothetical protein n=1 Tax=Pollutibacter soli TaxID=3034157 RepID=UPI0030140CC2